MSLIDFDGEIIKHLQWRTMVEGLLRHHQESFVTPNILIQDNKCDLGKWIYSEDSDEYETTQEFRQLLDSHKEFHIKAGTILSLCQQGKTSEAEEMEEAFYKLSGQVVKSLQALKELS